MKRAFTIVILIAAFFLNAQAYDFSAVCSSGQTLYYNVINATTVELSGCQEGASGNIVIPSSVSNNGVNYQVVKIGQRAFEWCSGLTGSLTIPEGITEIGNLAFSGCTGFNGTLSLPSTLTAIKNYAFYDCSGLTGTLTLPESLTTLGTYAFYNCSGFTGSLEIPAGITTLNSNVFRGCTGFNGTLTFSENLKTIGNYAFYGCTNFTGSLVIPNKVTSISTKAFYNCYGFNGTLTLSETLTKIEEQAFYNCHGFTGSLVFPSKVTNVETGAFENCSGFSGDLVIFTPTSGGTIKANSFKGCTGFNGALVISATITKIMEGAFSGCTGITSIVEKTITTPPTISSTSFQEIPTSTPLYVFCEIDTLFRDADYWNAFTNRIAEYPFVVSAISANEEMGTVQVLMTPTCEDSCLFRVEALPLEGYSLEKWTVQGSETSIGTDLVYEAVVKKDVVFVANFKEKNTSIITLEASPEAAGTVACTSTNLTYGSTINVTATPNPGYFFDSWMEDDTIVSTQASYSFVSEGDRTLTAYFFKDHPYIDAVASVEDGAEFTGIGEYNYGDEATLTVIPNENYTFVCWVDEDGVFVSDETSFSLTAQLDRTFTALLYFYVGTDESFESSICLYPNPTKGTFMVSGNNINNIEVYNAMGQLILSKEVSSESQCNVDLSNQPNGVYVLRLNNAQGTAIKKIVKE